MSKNTFLPIIKYTFFSILGIALALLVIGQFLRLTSPDVAAPGELFTIGGHKLHMMCAGPDSSHPTIVYEAGATMNVTQNYRLFNSLSKVMHTCFYDRAGIGWSEPSGTEQTANNIADQLHELMTKANIKKPFIYIGHSIGGIYLRAYHAKYPDDIAGLVFLDSSHPDQNTALHIEEVMKQENAEFINQLRKQQRLIRSGYTKIYNPRRAEVDLNGLNDGQKIQALYMLNSVANIEGGIEDILGNDKTLTQGQKLGNLGETPILVLTAGKPWTQEDVGPDGDPKELHRIWIDLQDKTASLSTNSQHEMVPGADHGSLVNDPEHIATVTSYIRDFMDSLSVQ